MRPLKYILDGHVPVPTDDYAAIERAIGTPVARTTIGNVAVSTVFLAIDHSFGEGPPLVFETLVFGGPCDGEQRRYSTWEQAEAGHAAMVDYVRAAHEP